MRAPAHPLRLAVAPPPMHPEPELRVTADGHLENVRAALRELGSRGRRRAAVRRGVVDHAESAAGQWKGERGHDGAPSATPAPQARRRRRRPAKRSMPGVRCLELRSMRTATAEFNRARARPSGWRRGINHVVAGRPADGPTGRSAADWPAAGRRPRTRARGRGQNDDLNPNAR